MNNDSVYRWLTSIKCTFSQLFDTFSSYDYSQSILTLVTSFIALNFIAYKFHFCVQYTELAVISGNHSYFLRIKCVGIWNVEGRKFSAACDIAFPKIRNLKCETRGFEVYFVRISVWIEVLVWFRRYRMHEKFIMKNLIFSSLIFSQIRP